MWNLLNFAQETGSAERSRWDDRDRRIVDRVSTFL
jgi:hypothetical protein